MVFCGIHYCVREILNEAHSDLLCSSNASSFKSPDVCFAKIISPNFLNLLHDRVSLCCIFPFVVRLQAALLLLCTAVEPHWKLPPLLIQHIRAAMKGCTEVLLPQYHIIT